MRQDPRGAELVPGKPLVVATRVENFGGVWDCRANQWHDESAVPLVWCLSEEQRELAVHGDHLPPKILCRGAEGAGKTRGVLAPWLILRAIEFAGQHVEIGATAPVQRRLETLRESLVEKMADEWFVWRQRDWLFRFALGVQLRLVSSHRQSEAEGSPLQGYDWVACGSDEAQDQLHVMGDIEARGRRAPGGRYRRMMSASVKDSHDYRAFEAKWETTKLCGVRSLPAFANPGVAPQHWENLRETLSPRDYRRRVLAEAVGPERKTYPDFERATHVHPIPFTARDVTHHALGIYQSYMRKGAAFHVLCGHDPGKVRNTTAVMRAFLFPSDLLVWMVVGEFITERTTQERHAAELRKYLRKSFGVDHAADPRDPDAGLSKSLIFRDPHGRGEQHPDDDVDQAFRRHGFDIFSPAPDKQVIKRRTRIEIMNRLILSDSGKVRFLVACDDRGEPAAPETFRSFNDQERDSSENPESLIKGEQDITHGAVACGYGLYPFEREELSDWTRERVLAGLRKAGMKS